MLPKWVKPYNIVELCAELCFTLPLSLSQKQASHFYTAIAECYCRCHTPVLFSFYTDFDLALLLSPLPAQRQNNNDSQFWCICTLYKK